MGRPGLVAQFLHDAASRAGDFIGWYLGASPWRGKHKRRGLLRAVHSQLLFEYLPGKRRKRQTSVAGLRLAAANCYEFVCQIQVGHPKPGNLAAAATGQGQKAQDAGVDGKNRPVPFPGSDKRSPKPAHLLFGQGSVLGGLRGRFGQAAAQFIRQPSLRGAIAAELRENGSQAVCDNALATCLPNGSSLALDQTREVGPLKLLERIAPDLGNDVSPKEALRFYMPTVARTLALR